MDAGFSDTTEPPLGELSDAVVVAKTVEGRSISRSVALTAVIGLAIVAFLGGQHLGQNRSGETVTVSGDAQDSLERPSARLESASTPTPDPTPQFQTGNGAANDATEPTEPAPASIEPGPGYLADTVSVGSSVPLGNAGIGLDDAPRVGGLRFEPFVEPTVLLESTTDPEFGNSVGFDVGTYTSAEVGALKINLRVTGSTGSIVAVHKGDRPDQAMRFVIPPSGVLVVPHLIAAVDDLGRIVISADSDVDIVAVGLGSYLAVERSRAGRFVSTGSEPIGSLVTAVDGRDLLIDLQQVPGLNLAHVGQVILRLNANVGTTGGTVTVVNDDTAALQGQGQIAAPAVMWPAPPTANLGLGGTALVMASPNAAGQIALNYLGGSVLTADLVGYYTSESAPASASGLLVLKPPVREELIPDRPDLQLTSIEPGEVLVLTTSNGPTGGPVAFAADPGLAEARPTFNIAPNQIRTSTVWADADSDGSTYLSVPPGALVSLWHIGTFID